MVNHPGVKKVCMLMLPAAAGLSIGQVNMFVDTILASLLREGSVTVIYFASRVMLLPLSLFGVAIATVSLPLMAESSVESDYNKFKSTMSSGLRMIFFTMLPSTFGLMFFGLPIIRVLFEHGRFKAYDSVITSQALFFFSIGLIAFAGVKVVVSAFYALKDTLTPVLVAVFAMVLNLLLNLIFIIPMGVGGIALATSLAAFFNLFLLMYELRAKIGALGISKMAVSFIKTIFASLPVIAVCILAETAFCNTSKYLQVVITLPLAVIVYLAAAYILKCKELNYILNAVLNRASKIPSAAGESRTTQQG
jgi:putative peptidoglycan lipid II flippase